MRFQNKNNLPEVDFEKQLSDIQESLIKMRDKPRTFSAGKDSAESAAFPWV